MPRAWISQHGGTFHMAFVIALGLEATACPSTCFGYTCDHWKPCYDGVCYGQPCAALEKAGCDCTGCSRCPPPPPPEASPPAPSPQLPPDSPPLPPPRACCRAMTADCLACAEGMDEAEYCAKHPQMIGCVTTPPVAARTCMLFCADKTDPWGVRCKWNGCGGCSECIATARQAREASCRPFCTTKTDTWEDKCMWNGCGACDVCPGLTVQPRPPPAAAPAECKPFCVDKTEGWTDKCNWGGCGGCPACLQPIPAPTAPEASCKPFCGGKTDLWEERCTWNGCGACVECSKER